eukprot:320942-Pyramimonas_sp.AAC.1
MSPARGDKFPTPTRTYKGSPFYTRLKGGLRQPESSVRYPLTRLLIPTRLPNTAKRSPWCAHPGVRHPLAPGEVERRADVQRAEVGEPRNMADTLVSHSQIVPVVPEVAGGQVQRSQIGEAGEFTHLRGSSRGQARAHRSVRRAASLRADIERSRYLRDIHVLAHQYSASVSHTFRAVVSAERRSASRTPRSVTFGQFCTSSCSRLTSRPTAPIPLLSMKGKPSTRRQVRPV